MKNSLKILILVIIILASGFYLYKNINLFKPSEKNSEILLGKEAEKLFIFNNKPIHPSCVDPWTEVHNLDECSNASTEIEFKDGYFSASNLEDPEYPSVDLGWVSYKVLAKKNDKFLLDVTASGGGTGIFSYLIWYELNSGRLIGGKKILAGDRCNGGFYVSEIKDFNVFYSVNVTPVDIIEKAIPGIVGFEYEENYLIKPYDDLEASASSCFATFNFKYDLNKEEEIFENANLIVPYDGTGISVNDEWTNSYRYQSCFNELFNEYIYSKKVELSAAELKNFGQQFLKKCNVK